MARPKAEASKSERDKSPNKKSNTEASTSRTFRKSPARTERQKSLERVANTPLSPAGRGPTRRSPSRRSPGRKSSVPKSPVRKPPTPGRRSPGRPPKSEKARSEKSRSPGRPRKQVIEVDSDSDSVELSHQANSEKPKAAVRGRARRLDSDYTSPKVLLHDIQTLREVPRVDSEISSYVGLVRRSFRKSLSREVDRIVHLKHNDTAVRKLSEFSDEDDGSISRSTSVREESERRSEPRIFEERIPKTEFGGWIVALFLILGTPLTILSFCVFCNKMQCSWTKLPSLQQYKNVSTYIDYIGLAVYSGYCLFMAIVTAIPFGGYKLSGMPNKQGKLSYVANGLFALVLTSIGVIAMERFNVPVTSYLTENYCKLLVSSVIIGVLFSVYLYIRSCFVPISALNPYAISSSRIYNFWIGREVNPRCFGVMDVKLCIMKIYAVAVVIMNASYISKNIQFTKTIEANASSIEFLKSADCNPTLLVITALQIIYAIDMLLFEYVFLSSFEIQYEAVGYMSSVLGFCGPFLTLLIPKYVYESRIRLPVWQLAAATLLFSIGYFLYRGSNLQKHAFRQNPYSPAISHLESIPTAQGKKLLVSGFWGFVRHPNYLGDLLIWSSFAIFVLNVPIVLIVLGDYIFLIHRAHRDGTRCKQRYGTAWDRYCQRVKYVLIPKVY